MNDVDNGLHFKRVLLEDDSLVLGEVLLALEPRDTLLLVLSDSAHFLPDLIFLAGELGLLALLVQLREIFIDTAIVGIVGEILV
jgi:hypothetical protein